MNYSSLNKNLFSFLPYLCLLFINAISNLLFNYKAKVVVSVDLIFLTLIIYYLSDQLQNIYNSIIAKGWLVFFILGILNMNSTILRTSVWNIAIHDASLLYLVCLLTFTLSLVFLERNNIKLKWYSVKSELKFRLNLKRRTSKYLLYIIIIFPFLLFISIYVSIGFIPIITGESFVDEMYNFDYGPLYGFKFLCVYSFIIALYQLRIKKKKMWLVYIVLLFFIVSIDGKRFIGLLCLLSFIPVYLYTNKLKGIKTSYMPIVLISISVFFLYIYISILRVGGDIAESTAVLIDNIPFGVEYKDYVHSYNTFIPMKIRGYNFELSAVGAFFNSSLLETFGYNKESLVHKGSAHVWMNLYDQKFGIRTGIISELYFAYSYLVIPLMVPIAFLTSKVSEKLLSPQSFFNLMQNSILFSLIFLLINGQATVFFGCLTIMVYMYILHKFLGLKI